MPAGILFMCQLGKCIAIKLVITSRNILWLVSVMPMGSLVFNNYKEI